MAYKFRKQGKQDNFYSGLPPPPPPPPGFGRNAQVSRTIDEALSDVMSVSVFVYTPKTEGRKIGGGRGISPENEDRRARLLQFQSAYIKEIIHTERGS